MANIFFKARFLDAIRQRTKTSTIRRPRRIRVDERLHLFTGSRFAPIKLGTARAVWVSDITLHLDSALIIIPGRQISTTADLEAFAVHEGFTGFDELREFFRTMYRAESFTGTLIKWGGTFDPEDLTEVNP